MRLALCGLALWLLAQAPAQACRIERTDAKTITIFGPCSETFLQERLAVAIKTLDSQAAPGSSGHGSSNRSSSDDTKPPSAVKIDLVNGQMRGGTATFFHRKSK